MKSADDEVNRIMGLLDIGIKAVRAGDGDAALMAVKAAHDSALRLPQKPGLFCLPDKSSETPEGKKL